MDVILDSNIYISDFKLAKPWFSALFDYLRRTGSEIILLEPVREEVLATFERKWTEKWNAIKAATESLKLIGASAPAGVRAPAMKGDSLALNSRLLHPSKDIKSRFYSDYLDFGVDDVVKRGARRIKPANNEGEELRDVVIWLMVLQYATFEKKSVAFITADKGFWQADQIHPHISADIRNKNAAVEMFRDVPSFLTAKMPQPTAVDSAWVRRHVHGSILASSIRSAAIADATKRFLPFQWAPSAGEITLELADGQLYVTGNRSTFAELTFRFRLPLEASSSPEPSIITRGINVHRLESLQSFLVDDKTLVGDLIGDAVVFVRLAGSNSASVDVHRLQDVRLTNTSE